MIEVDSEFFNNIKQCLNCFYYDIAYFDKLCDYLSPSVHYHSDNCFDYEVKYCKKCREIFCFYKNKKSNRVEMSDVLIELNLIKIYKYGYHLEYYFKYGNVTFHTLQFDKNIYHTEEEIKNMCKEIPNIIFI